MSPPHTLQVRKQLRQSLRRLNRSVEATEAARAAGLLPVTGTLARVREILAESAATEKVSPLPRYVVAANAPAPIIIGAAPPARVKRLRHTFNTGLRAVRLAADLEDVTDDEEEVRLGIVDHSDPAFQSERERSLLLAGDAPSPDDDNAVEQAGVKKAPNRPLPKRDMSNKAWDGLRDGCGGVYESHPVLQRERSSHRRGKRVAAAATAAVGIVMPPGKKPYRFWRK